MKLEGYTPEVFLENFTKDCAFFGEETAQAIYEEIFSAICNKKIILDNFSKRYNSLMETIAEEEMLVESPSPSPRMQEAIAYAEHAKNAALANQKVNGFSLQTVANIMNAAAEQGGIPNTEMAYFKGIRDEIYANSNKEAAEAFNSTMEKLAKQATSQNVVDTAKTGFLSKIGKFITSLPLKVKEFFGGLKGKSFSEIMKQGMAWLQANPMLALKTTGGIALVALLIRALKKRGQLNKYKQLQAIYDRGRELKEDIEEDTPEGVAMGKVIEECKTNKALNNLIFGEEKIESKKSYFEY